MSDHQHETTDSFTPWTNEGSARLLAAASAVQDAIAVHARALIAADRDDEAVFLASEDLMPALLAYADAQFDFTGYGFPLGVLAQLEDEDEEDDDDDDGPDELPTTGFSVVQRHDYVVTDADAVLAVAGATHLGEALYEIAHAGGGWDSLREVDGLEPVAGITAVVDQPALLGPDPDDWAEAVHDEHAEVLFSQADVFRN